MELNIKKLFLVRHAAHEGEGPDPAISTGGREQARRLAEVINKKLNGENVVIWTSSAKRAHGTAMEIGERLVNLERVEQFEKLWADGSHDNYDFENSQWLYGKIKSAKVEALIIVSHLEYVQYFPIWIGGKSNEAEYAEGIFRDKGGISFISHQDYKKLFNKKSN